MNKTFITILLLIVIYLSAWWASISYADSIFDSSPMNFDNSILNFDNSMLNYENSILNFENSPMNYDSHRIIRSPEGEVLGYGVPKQNGGMNIYNINGDRIGYTK